MVQLYGIPREYQNKKLSEYVTLLNLEWLDLISFIHILRRVCVLVWRVGLGWAIL